MKVKILNIIDNRTFKAVATLYRAHKKYGKYIVSHKRYLVHYEAKNTINVGDEVCISQTRPISKTKRWVLINSIL